MLSIHVILNKHYLVTTWLIPHETAAVSAHDEHHTTVYSVTYTCFFMLVETKMLCFKMPYWFSIVSYLQAAPVIENLAWYHSWDVHFWSNV